MTTTQSTKESASEVLAYCGSCKMDLMATIVAKVGSKIARVFCKTCKKERAYKAAKGVTSPGDAPTAVSSSSAKKKSSKTEGDEEQKSVSIETEWKRLMTDAAAAKKVSYSPKAVLSLGDVVQHPTFGAGIVMRISYPNKAEIIFQDSIRLLIHSRATV